MDVTAWLRGLGLDKYEAAFRDNDIDEAVLASLTHDTLKEIGVTTVGHRLKLLDAIAALRTDAGAKAPSTDAASFAAPSVPVEDRAERRQVTVCFRTWWALRPSQPVWTLRTSARSFPPTRSASLRRCGGSVSKRRSNNPSEERPDIPVAPPE
jgi:SAM domain (Sterile alpha motif)